ncbi:MAG: DUF1850 domain-containing protein [Synergistaceae bacterium]|jgi:hypothetical protein|nr:DUF1850 domain-containing protein [Synergistaceae bacterium]
MGFLSAARAATAILCGVLLLAEMPVNCLSISGDGVLYISVLPNGASFTTTYEHSVERTPVVDEYRIVGGNIWGWEERVRSHNAGLPFSAPPHGSFIMNSDWMIVRGGRRPTASIAYRVGDAEIGMNTWELPPFDRVNAFGEYPSRRVFIESSVRKFREAPTKGWTVEMPRRQ